MRSATCRNACTPNPLATYRLVVEYDGTDFCGLQFQPQVRTVAGELERALGALFSSDVRIAAAGRTDTGVHATGQVISFKAEREFPIDRLALALNATLPPDLSVRDAAVVAGDFSARFDALGRTYEYLVLNQPLRSALLRRWTHHVHRPIDEERFREAARELVGKHDFVAFCGMLPEFGGTERTIQTLELERDGALLRIRIAADGFLHHMVRVVAGTLLEIGTGRREPAEIAAILASRDRRRAGYTAPASGLFLAGVRYPDFDSYARPEPAFTP